MAIEIPSSPADRRKLYIAGGVLLVCMLWLGYYFISQMTFTGPDRTLATPGWKVASEVYNKLIENHDYADVALRVETEKPLKITVLGEVRSQEAFDRLPQALKDLNGEAEFDIQVQKVRH